MVSSGGISTESSCHPCQGLQEGKHLVPRLWKPSARKTECKVLRKPVITGNHTLTCEQIPGSNALETLAANPEPTLFSIMAWLNSNTHQTLWMYKGCCHGLSCQLFPVFLMGQPWNWGDGYLESNLTQTKRSPQTRMGNTIDWFCSRKSRKYILLRASYLFPYRHWREKRGAVAVTGYKIKTTHIYIYTYIYIYIPEKGGRKPASKQMLRRRFFSLRFMLCVLHLRAVHHRDQFFAAGRFTTATNPVVAAWRIIPEILHGESSKPCSFKVVGDSFYTPHA